MVDSFSAIKRKVDDWGRITFHGDDAVELLMRGCDITQMSVEITPEIEEYNAACLLHDKASHVLKPMEPLDISPEEYAKARQSHWFIPSEYLQLDVREKLLGLCTTEEEIERVTMEMDMFEERELTPVLQLMCFLVDYWRAKNIVWGVGRGSSVASYCLFLIGVHRINSIYYDLDIHEFLK